MAEANPNAIQNNNQDISQRLEVLACATKLRNWMLQMPNDIQQEIRTEFGSMCRQAGLDELEGQRLLQDVFMGRPGAVQSFVGQISRNGQLVAALRKLAGLL